ncbi:hypothetical protein EJ03DRAFT_330670 [Teratosphaeria nubilosa]|uniref:Uncharacterized protein n=1 Tax=Teratosphaeria nubilosa TaxID=161662 RepID=A0A6G1KYV7_9PEZI|nr:hypothetical protein EJ03DRAFT_330670 [Teratosphaeria nubilosa]
MATIIAFDYDGSPYGQKIRLILTALKIPFSRLDQPMILPRPDLAALGITYRRIPLLAIGKDVYADTACITSAVIPNIASLGGDPDALTFSSADKAFEVWGVAAFRNVVSGLLDPTKLPKEFINDRATIFPSIKRPDAATLRPSGLASLKARMMQVENEFLGAGGPFIHGSKISLADIHVAWPFRWVLFQLQVRREPGFGPQDFPKVYKLLESLPKPAPKNLKVEEVHSTIRGASYWAQSPGGVAQGDPLRLKTGMEVKIEDFDAAPGAHIQVGKLIGTTEDETVVEVGKDGIRLHYPRVGYIVRPVENSNL